MFQEFKIAPDEIMPLRHFDEDQMSYESFQFRESGPKVRIPTYASQPALYAPTASILDVDSDDFYPSSTSSKPSDVDVQQLKRHRNGKDEDLVGSNNEGDVDQPNGEKLRKIFLRKTMRWMKNPAAEMQELTGWVYTPVSYSFVFLVGIVFGIMYQGWLTDLATDGVL